MQTGGETACSSWFGLGEAPKVERLDRSQSWSQHGDEKITCLCQELNSSCLENSHTLN